LSHIVSSMSLVMHRWYD